MPSLMMAAVDSAHTTAVMMIPIAKILAVGNMAIIANMASSAISAHHRSLIVVKAPFSISFTPIVMIVRPVVVPIPIFVAPMPIIVVTVIVGVIPISAVVVRMFRIIAMAALIFGTTDEYHPKKNDKPYFPEF